MPAAGHAPQHDLRSTGACRVALAGCGATVPSPAPSSAPAGAADFTIQNFRFPVMTAAPGRRIAVADGDSEPHTVTADDGSFDSGSFDSPAPGSLVAPTTPGTYPVHCTVHPSMHGTLTVR